MKSLDGYRILLVEDEVMILIDLQHLLESKGATVDTAMTVADALRVSSNQFDAAVLDVRLPDGNVFPVADRLIEHGVPVVFHSGHARTEQVMDEFPGSVALTKPASETILINTIKSQASIAESG